MANSGDPLPQLQLPGVDGDSLPLAALRGRIVALVFWSAECAWSQAYDEWLGAHLGEWEAQGVTLVVVDTNADEDDARVRSAQSARALRFAVRRDPQHALADALGATHTPHVFVYARDGRLAYRGALDDRTFRRRVANVNYLERALAAVLAGRAPEPAETQPYGCAIVRAA